MIPEEAVAQVAATLGITTARARRLAHTALPAGFVRSVHGADHVVVVEGATDEAVLSVVLPEVRIAAAGGKAVLPLAAAVVAASGASVHVVLDADGDGWRRARNPSLARANHRRATARVVADLHWTTCTVLPDDLEAELARWPSFLAALAHGSSGLLAKDPVAYSAAARAASRDDRPQSLRDLTAAVSGH